MTTRITVRLPDDLVDAVDEVVARGGAASRAEVVTRALRRELRRQRAITDLERIDGDDDPELAAWTANVARRPVD